jgi:thiol-disulfide isomerase/thioredoxin
MKKLIVSISCIAVFVTVFYSCEEVGPDIDFTIPDSSLLDTSYVEGTVETPQLKMVLFEDFTGVQCVNCPTAHEETEELLAEYPDQLAVVAMHNYFAGPFADSNEDYTITEANDLNSYLGPAPAWPSGFIDRKDFGTGTLYTLLVSNYKVYVEQQLPEVPPCNIYLESSYDNSTRKAIVKATVKYTEATDLENHLSIMILEDDIIDLQLGLGGIEEDYVHKHILRDMLTPATGVNLIEEKTPGRVFEKEFSITLPNNWNEENMSWIVFVHNFSETNKEVLQAAKAPL